MSDDCTIIKYAHDTAILCKIVIAYCEGYLTRLFFEWRKLSSLELNTQKNKEMIFDFRTKNKKKCTWPNYNRGGHCRE